MTPGKQCSDKKERKNQKHFVVMAVAIAVALACPTMPHFVFSAGALRTRFR
jgi:hypothetical protein